ncbi:MAG: tRNA (N(6)-L-threonylcarbamoyladenosine(37)-C(2))-methylthiotransferase [Candidatus Methanomethylicia archaeon]|nr:tRNA (N(6)-L-threonylcarbamoyladenosine(37)-C(2))-methylthiotransferase [Candidatus Methanomethylicia archaeon]
MRIYIESYGCAVNNADTNLMRKILSEKYEIVRDPLEANVIIINTCTVRGETERKMIRRIKKLEDIRSLVNGKLIVTGCMAKVQPAIILKISPNASLVSPQKISEILEVVESNAREIRITGSGSKDLDKMVLSNEISITIPIAEGCIGNCSYCIVKLARGNLKSYPENEIVKTIEIAVNSGVKEIRLTAQDTAAYGLDKDTNLAKLLKKILKINGNYVIRIGMMTPNNALKILDELMEAYIDERVYKFIHIPLQSGDNYVLKTMGRRYTIEDFMEIVKKFRENYPNGFITTDIISGFPTENHEAHMNTLKVIEESKPDKVNVAKYTPRPHTKAAALPQLPEKIRSERCREVMELARKIALERNKNYEGKRIKVLVLRERKKNLLESRSMEYRLIMFEGCNKLIGKKVDVNIIKAESTRLIGSLPT